MIDDYVIHPPARLMDEAKGGEAMLQMSHAAEADAIGAKVGNHLVRAHSRIIRLKRETTSSDSEVEGRRPEARDTAVSRWLKAMTKAGLV